jgi:hypothetical protein
MEGSIIKLNFDAKEKLWLQQSRRRLYRRRLF